MLFLNSELQLGLNVTVQRGDKWFNKATINDSVSIFKTGEVEPDKMISQGMIVGIAYLPCNMIPNEWLLLEHDALCRNQRGLCRAMRKAYPGFCSDDLVTVLLFSIS